MNNIKSLIIVLVSAITLTVWGSSALAQESRSAFDQMYPTASLAGYHPMSWDTFQASWLIGHRVYSPLRGELGQVEDLMIDSANGRIALVILSGVPGFAAGYVAAPFSALERTGEVTFQLDFGDRYASLPWGNYNYRDTYADDLYEWRSIVGLSMIPSAIDPLWADSVYQFYGQKPYWTEGKKPHPDIMSYRTERPALLESLLMGRTAPALMGARAQSKDGKKAGRIDDVVIDSENGRVTLLVLDKVPGRGNVQVAVPFNALNRTGKDTFSLSIVADELVSIPSFRTGDMNNRGYTENAYRFFGLQPYWTARGDHRGMDPYRWGGEAQDF
jgi:sporulation protein YlmC with PRC-barrel domain